MKSVKITKKMLQDPELLLMKCDAVKGRNAYPGRVYMLESDYEILKKNLKKRFKKEYPYLIERRLEMSVNMTLLNLGPVTLKKGIQKGFLLVDDRGLQEDILKDQEDLCEHTLA